MIIHSDKLTYRDIVQAANAAGAVVEQADMKGSKSRKRAFKFYLSGSSPYAPGFGRSFGDDVKAASWDEWGIVFNHLFEIDPEAHCGKRGYQNAEHFHWMTGDRFRTLQPHNQHRRHKWGLGQPNCTGAYSVAYCDCGAMQRWLVGAKSWDEIVNA